MGNNPPSGFVCCSMRERADEEVTDCGTGSEKLHRRHLDMYEEGSTFFSDVTGVCVAPCGGDSELLAVSSPEWIHIFSVDHIRSAGQVRFSETSSMGINGENSTDMRLDFLKSIGNSHVVGCLNALSSPPIDVSFLRSLAPANPQPRTPRKGMRSAPTTPRTRTRSSEMLPGPPLSARPRDGNNNHEEALDQHQLLPGMLQMWDVTSGVPKEPISASVTITCIGIASTGIYVGDVIGHCCLYSRLEDKLIFDQRARLQQGPLIALDCDWHSVYSIGASCNISVWDPGLQKEQVVIHAQHDAIEYLTDVLRPFRSGVFYGFGREALYTAEIFFIAAVSHSSDGMLLSWDLGTRVCKSCVKAHHGPISSLIFAPTDFGVLITGGADGCMRFWDTSDMSCLKCISTGEGEVLKVVAGHASRFFTMGSTGCLTAWSIFVTVNSPRTPKLRSAQSPTNRPTFPFPDSTDAEHPSRHPSF